jgi:hypothetical protein
MCPTERYRVTKLEVAEDAIPMARKPASDEQVRELGRNMPV